MDASPQEWHPKNLFWRWHYGPSTISNFGANLKPAGPAHFAPRTSIRLPPSSARHANACQNRESMQRWRHQSRIAAGAACHNTILLSDRNTRDSLFYGMMTCFIKNGFLTPRIGRDTNVHQMAAWRHCFHRNLIPYSRAVPRPVPCVLQNDVLEQARRLLRQVLMQREWIPSDLVIVKNASFFHFFTWCSQTETASTITTSTTTWIPWIKPQWHLQCLRCLTFQMLYRTRTES